MDITFINIHNFPHLEQPQPSDRFIPDWYKNQESYLNNKKEPLGNGISSATIKKCMPVFDAITAGYIITTPTDVCITQKDGDPYYEWPSMDSIGFHNAAQAVEHPNRNGLEMYPKFVNFWGIKTPPGYSCLFVQPFHRESVFTVLPGIVDTDTYTLPVNFPFVLNDKNYSGIIPAGTPMAQVIPFKRESWSAKLATEKDVEESSKVSYQLKTKFFDSYKSMFRTPKEYK